MEPDLTTTLFDSQLTSVNNWVQGNPYLGWGLFIIFLLLFVAMFFLNSLASIDILRSKLLKPWARSRQFKQLTKAAKKYDIRGHVNKAVAELKSELPAGWIREMDIEWVEREDKEDFFHDDEIVVRVRPYDEQNRNFVTVVHQFLSKALFPKVKKVIPGVQRDAAILHFSGRIAKQKGDDTYSKFVDCVFEPAVDREAKIVDYHERYKDLDTKGLFTGPFLREIQHIAEEIRTSTLRHQMGSELNEVLKHLEEFSKKYDESQDKNNGDRKPMEEYLWTRAGAVSKYALLLVAHPIKAMVGGTGQYVRRAQKDHDAGVERLYVLGASKGNNFSEQVITAIANGTQYRLVERFELSKDYRGDAGGVGAVFAKVINH